MLTILHFLPQMLQGVLLTMMVLICALALGLMLSFLFTFCLERQVNRYLSYLIHIYLFIFRGTPTLVQIFIIYYGAGQISLIRYSFLWQAFKQPFFCAVLALGLNTAAYTTALFTGAIRAIPRGEIQAGIALGFNNVALYQKIIIPRLFSIILPAYSNEVVMVLKSTSLVSAITLPELTGVTQTIIGQTYMTSGL
ncbi:MAG: ABC transporter permease subunit [Pseudomonadota bacterium]